MLEDQIGRLLDVVVKKGLGLPPEVVLLIENGEKGEEVLGDAYDENAVKGFVFGVEFALGRELEKFGVVEAEKVEIVVEG